LKGSGAEIGRVVFVPAQVIGYLLVAYIPAERMPVIV
jgi:hypothetical protein